MSRGLRRSAVALLIACLAAAGVPAQGTAGNQGVIISEVVHGPSQPPVGGVAMPSYVELVNVRIANPVVPPPVPIGNAASGPATLLVSVNGQPAIPITIPTGFFVGGNVQPSPAAQPPALPLLQPVILLASGSFPTGVLPTPMPGQMPVQVIPLSALFSGPNALLGAPGVPFEICFHNPPTGLSDKIHLGPGTAGGCMGAPFINTLTFAPNTGRAIRWTYMDSNTDIDFDSGFPISPGDVNPQMVHVNGFNFGTTGSPALAGTPLVAGGTPTAGTLAFLPTAHVKSVHFFKKNNLGVVILDRTISNPQFDPIINAPVTLTANFTAQTASISQAGFLPGLTIMNEMMTITTASPAGTGMLNMPMNVSTQVGVQVVPSGAFPLTDIRPARIFTDQVADSGAFVNGIPTAAGIDVIPPSTGGGNVWCEIIVYDYQGNQYRAKVKNWPPGGACMGTPFLGLGTDLMGSITIMDLCFNPNGAMVANLFSASPVATCGSFLFPNAGGICFDGSTQWILTAPQLGSQPFFATTDAAGMYLYQLPSGTLTSLSGITFEALGVEYTAAGMIVQQSGINSVTL